MEDFDSDNILLGEKLYENIFIYDISYETLIGEKPLRIRFYKIDTVEPRFFEHAIFRIPQFFKLFPWSLRFALRNTYKLSRIF